MNKVILLGRLSRDPEIRYSQSAEPMCIARFNVAVDRRFKKEGQQTADFIYCVAFGKTGEFIERFFKKGMSISLCGNLRVEKYTDKEGNDRWSTEVVCDEVNFGESKSAYEARMASRGGSDNYDNSYTPPAASSKQGASSAPEGFSAIAQSIDEDDDLPF